MKIYVGHSRSFDFQTELYQPLRQSELNKQVELILPHENGRESYDSKEGLKDTDYMLAEVSYPSTGLGIELGWASSYGIPIIAAHKRSTQLSNSVKHIAAHVIEYGTIEELIGQIKDIVGV